MAVQKLCLLRRLESTLRFTFSCEQSFHLSSTVSSSLEEKTADAGMKAAMDEMLPQTVVLKNGEKVVIDHIDKSNISELFKITQANSRIPSAGISSTDFPSVESILQLREKSFWNIQCTLETSGKCIGFCAMFPSEICRSCRPISSRGYTVVHPDYYNMGLGQAVTWLCLDYKTKKGYICHVARTSITNTLGTYYSRKSRLSFQAWVPDSYQDTGGRWHDELLATHTEQFKLFPRISQASQNEVIQRALQDPVKLVYEKKLFKGKNISFEFSTEHGTFTMRTVPKGNINSMYEIYVDSALKGEAFGVDEYPSFQIFKNHFLKERVMISLEKSSPKVVIATAVVGPSRICRTPDPLSCSIYMLVMPEYRNKGIGTQFVKHLFMYIKQSGYSAVLTDVLVTKVVPYRFMTRLGFSNVGCIPKSSYVAGIGYSDAILFYHKLDTESKL